MVGEVVFEAGILLLAVLASAILISAANILAHHLLRRYPELLATPEQRNNRLNREYRKQLVPVEKRASWFDLASPDEQNRMWDELYEHGNEFECFTHFRQKPFLGKYYGVTEHGYRLCREPGPWPPRPENFNILFFGGSTAFGVGPYWATVASYLQDCLNAPPKALQRLRL